LFIYFFLSLSAGENKTSVLLNTRFFKKIKKNLKKIKKIFVFLK